MVACDDCQTVIKRYVERVDRTTDISFYPHACRKPKPRGAGGGPRPCWTDEQARVDSRDVSETERAFRLAPRKRAFRILDRFRPSDASPTRPQWNTHPALRPWGGGCVLPVRPGSGGGPAPPRALSMRMAPARSSQIRPFARGTATGPREAVEARGRPYSCSFQPNSPQNCIKVAFSGLETSG